MRVGDNDNSIVHKIKNQSYNYNVLEIIYNSEMGFYCKLLLTNVKDNRSFKKIIIS